jgi:hypothetical protein
MVCSRACSRSERPRRYSASSRRFALPRKTGFLIVSALMPVWMSLCIKHASEAV